jgi:UDP-glucuronate 4-epimerase
LLEDNDKLEVADKFQPDIIIHPAAQAGLRYSLENPRAYINSNIIGTFNVMELARKYKVKHILMASTSSVYGANTNMPFTENDKVDIQLIIYAAIKKSNESMAHSYAHLWKIPNTMFRFFTVCGP